MLKQHKIQCLIFFPVIEILFSWKEKVFKYWTQDFELFQCDVTAIEKVAAWKYRGLEKMSLVFFLATGCLFSNSAGKNTNTDSWARHYSPLAARSYSVFNWHSTMSLYGSRPFYCGGLTQVKTHARQRQKFLTLSLFPWCGASGTMQVKPSEYRPPSLGILGWSEATLSSSSDGTSFYIHSRANRIL